jgi:hypothetical protein
VFLTVYLTVDSVRSGELTWPKLRDNWGLAYAGLFLTAVVLILGARLIFPRLAPQGRLLTRSGIIVFFVLWLGNMVTVIYRTGSIPPIAIVVVVAAIGGIAIRKWFS